MKWLVKVTGIPFAPEIGPRRAGMAALVLMALALRWQFVGFQSGDFRTFLSVWYAYINTHGHLAALRDPSFSNYNTPYLALLALASYLPVPAIVAIKAISVLFDLVLASFGALIVREVRPGSTWTPTVAFGALLFLPTVTMNSGVWAQCDSIYAAGCLASVLSLIKGRPWAASAWFGVAFAFKLQAIFLLPVLVAVLIVNRHRIWALVAAPVTFLACLVPALLAGRSLMSQLLVYPNQITDSSGAAGNGGGAAGGAAGGVPGGVVAGGARPSSPGQGVGGGFTLNDGQSFTHNAPTIYAWLPPNASVGWMYAGLGLTAVVVGGFGVWLLVRRRRLGSGHILLVAAAATLLVPLLLPEMHERYFYLAEVLTVLAIFVEPRHVLSAVAIQFASVTTYLNYLQNQSVFPLGAAAAAALAGGLIAVAIVIDALSRPSLPAGQGHQRGAAREASGTYPGMRTACEGGEPDEQRTGSAGVDGRRG